MATTEKCADGREHLYLCSTCGKHGPEDADIERLTGERDDWKAAAKDHVVNNARLVEERDRLQSAFDTQQGWLNECQVELKRKL